MVELFNEDKNTDNRQSSKGNQLKWLSNKIWYKADYTGYEGLVEYTVSNLLKKTTLAKDEYILYNTEEIVYRNVKYLGCKSVNFLPEGWQMLTLERLFHNFYNESLSKSLYAIKEHENRLTFLVNQVVRITGLKKFGVYMSKLLTIDTFFLNEDRHTHNIAVLMDEKGEYHYCPIFDNGAALLSDTTMDYPMSQETLYLIGNVTSKTFCYDFDEQLDIAEQLYGTRIKLGFNIQDVRDLLSEEPYYPEDVKGRVQEIIFERMRKYRYLFEK